MQSKYSNPQPLSAFCRLPNAWFDVSRDPSARPAKRGRRAIKDKYPCEMASLQTELARLYNEYRNTPAGGTAQWSASTAWLYNTWINLVR